MSKPISLILWIVGIIVVVFLAWHIFISITIRKAVDDKITELSDIAIISYKKCSVNSFDHGVTLHDIRVALVETNQIFKIEKITWKTGDIRIQNLFLDIDKADSRADYIRQLGYHGKIPISFSIKTERKSTHTLHLLFTISAPTIASLVIEGNFNRLPFLDANILRPSIYTNITVHNVAFRYTDNSYIKRSLKVAAEKHKATVKEWKKHIISVFDKAAENSSNSFKHNSLKQIKQFIENPTTISCSMHPDTPKTVGEIFAHIHDIHYISAVLHTKIIAQH